MNKNLRVLSLSKEKHAMEAEKATRTDDGETEMVVGGEAPVTKDDDGFGGASDRFDHDVDCDVSVVPGCEQAERRAEQRRRVEDYKSWRDRQLTSVKETSKKTQILITKNCQ